ncbi:autotransporter domain-containing protein [Pseudodesulfovibrio sp.]|uniref:autotransporter domain-containing protein n=1 Tax=unclassified Pseudodesulfovibrio TaxID=2661612 RepID=UPI003AFFE475
MTAGRLHFPLLCLLLQVLLSPATSAAVSVDSTGQLVPGYIHTYGYGVTSGGAIVGNGEDASSNRIAFYWTPTGGTVQLSLGGTDSAADDISKDGGVVVGYADVGGKDHAFYWEAASNTMHDIHDVVLAQNSEAYAVSSDGLVAVGGYQDWTGNEQSFYWTNSLGMIRINPVGTDTDSRAYGANADGSVIVGSSDGVSTLAYRWTKASNTAVSLGVIAPFGTTSESEAFDVNADGSVVVGTSTSVSFRYAAFRWTEETGMVDLGDLGGFWTEARAVSDDGNIVVGFSMNSAMESEGFVWTGLGMKSVNDMLADAGVDMAGLKVEECTNISGDGTTIVGNGQDALGHYNAYLIRDAGIVTPSALNLSLTQLSAVASDISYMAMGTMRGIMDQADHLPAPGKSRFWIVGSLLGDTSLPGRDKGGEGGIGVSRELLNGLTLGTGLFLGRRSVDTKFGGSQDSSMFGPGAYLSYAPRPVGLRFKLGALYERAHLKLDRGYPNGAGSTVASGSTDGEVFSLSSHLGWMLPLSDTFSVQPYVEYEGQFTRLDAYSESDTPFPAHFNERRDTMSKGRLGMELRCAAAENLDLWSWAAWSHRFESKGPSMDGYLLGLNDFSFQGARIDQDWGEIGAGFKLRPSDNVEIYSRATAAVGNDRYAAPDLALTSGLSWSF